MNQRIQELALQAGYTPLEPRAFADDLHEVFLKKFAELIVKECMSINTQRLFSDYEGDTHRVAHNNALWCAWGDIQKHFGVEE